MIRSAGSVSDQRKDLLAIRGIERATRLFREAVALLYVADYGGEVQVSFAMDAKLFESQMSARLLSPEDWKRWDSAQPISLHRICSNGTILDPALLNSMGKEDRVETLQDEIAKADVTVQQSIRDLEKCDFVQEKIVLSTRLDQARLILADKQRELERVRVRELCCYDFSPLLDDALTSAKQRLVIVSLNVTAKVLNCEMLKKVSGTTHCRCDDIYHNWRRIRAKNHERSGCGAQNLFGPCTYKYTDVYCAGLAGATLCPWGRTIRSPALAAFDWLGHNGRPSQAVCAATGRRYS